MSDDPSGQGVGQPPRPSEPPPSGPLDIPPPLQPPQAPPTQQVHHVYTATPVATPRTNGLAVASLILGILWVCYLGSLLAVIFGHVGLSQIKKSNGMQTGSGLAIAGLVLGYIGLGVLIFAMLSGVASIGLGGL